MIVQESFTPVRVAANGTVNIPNGIAGFTADAAGNMTLTIGGTVMLSNVPVVVGQYNPLPYAIPLGTSGANTLVLSGGASGVAGVY